MNVQGENTQTAHLLPVVVMGNGWAALAVLAHELGATEHKVIWIPGSGSELLSPLPGSTLAGARAWREIARFLGHEVGERQDWPQGAGLRYFRNKALRAWRVEDNEALPPAERFFASLSESRFEESQPELERALRAKIASYLPREGASQRAEPARLRRISAVSVRGFSIHEGQLESVELSSGERITTSRVYACDRWSELPAVSGLPKGLPFLRKRDPYGVLQVTFTHTSQAADHFIQFHEGFFAPLQREAGEEFDRHVWGGFHGNQSTWTVTIDPEQVQDNHAIAKRLRRMKAALDKVFAQSLQSALGAEATFQSTLLDETVRFEEESIFSQGEPPRGTIELPHVEGVYFLTDGYGPSEAALQAMHAQGWQLAEATPQLETVVLKERAAPAEIPTWVG